MSIKSSIKAVSHWPLLRYFAHSGMRKENHWALRFARWFLAAGRWLYPYLLLFGIGIVCSILWILLIFSFLTGGSLV